MVMRWLLLVGVDFGRDFACRCVVWRGVVGGIVDSRLLGIEFDRQYSIIVHDAATGDEW